MTDKLWIVKIPIFLLAWIGYIAIKIPTALIGLFVVPFLYEYRDVDYSKLPKWSRPWSNPEDWQGGPLYALGRSHNSLPDWWITKKGHNFKSFYRYHAIRNSANGLRSFEWLDLDVVPSKVEYRTRKFFDRYEPAALRKLNAETGDFGITVNTCWYLCWQGWQAGFKFVHLWNDEKHMVVKLGWRIEPKDKRGLPDSVGLRDEDIGFAGKVLFYRKG